MRDQLLRYVTPSLVVLGNLSNVCALLVLRRKVLRQQSVSVYLTAYAIANILLMDVVLGPAWFCYVLEKPYIGTVTDWGCRLWTFISNVVLYCGIWFIVGLISDRFIHLCYSQKAASYCTVFSAKTITLVILIALVVVSIHAMWTFELQPQGCFVSIGQDDWHVKTWPLWSATFYSYLPLTILFFLNIALVVSVWVKRHKRTTTGNTDDFIIPTLILTSTFFLLTTPATAANLVDVYFPMSRLSTDIIAKIELTKSITEIFNIVNQVLLSPILFLFSRTFRRDMTNICRTLGGKCRTKTTNSKNSVSSQLFISETGVASLELHNTNLTTSHHNDNGDETLPSLDYDTSDVTESTKL